MWIINKKDTCLNVKVVKRSKDFNHENLEDKNEREESI